MKKLVVLFLALFAIFVLNACARSGDVLRVGMDLRYPPFETEEGGEPIGISVDVAMAFGEFIGREVEIVNTNFAGLIPALDSGEIDIVIASMSRTDERAQVVDFSDPYFYFKIISLVNKDYAEANNLTEDSTTEDILALEGTQFVGVATQVSANLPAELGKDVTEATDLSTAVTSLTQGTSDILMMSAFPVVNNHKANRDTTMVIWDPFEVSPISMAVAQGNTELLEQANEFIATLDEPGGLYEELTAKWEDEVRGILERYGLEFFINE